MFLSGTSRVFSSSSHQLVTNRLNHHHPHHQYYVLRTQSLKIFGSTQTHHSISFFTNLPKYSQNFSSTFSNNHHHNNIPPPSSTTGLDCLSWVYAAGALFALTILNEDETSSETTLLKQHIEIIHEDALNAETQLLVNEYQNNNNKEKVRYFNSGDEFNAENFIPSWRSSVNWIILSNLAVFGLWKTRYEPFIFQNFLLSNYNLRVGRYWTLLSSTFSHKSTLHLAFNMIALNSFGKKLEREVGIPKFLGLYFTAGIVGSIFLCAKGLYRPNFAGLGASGCLYGAFVTYALQHPDVQFSIIFLPFFSFSALSGMQVAVCVDILGTIHNFLSAKGIKIVKWQSRLGHEAHLGGALIGFLFYELYLKSAKPNENERLSLKQIIQNFT